MTASVPIDVPDEQLLGIRSHMPPCCAPPSPMLTGVALGPGRGFGPGGQGCVRFALVVSEERLLEAAKRIGAWLAQRAADAPAGGQ